MAESRLQRWSRKKTNASRKPEPAPLPAIESEPSPEAQELALNEALPEHEVLEKYGLPDPDTIELGTDITGFMRKEIPDLLRRKALRVLWKSNPVLAVLDGLNDYDEDFSDAATAADSVKTIYKVGQGMFDKSAKVTEQVADQIEEEAEVPDAIAPAESTESLASESADGPSTTAGHVESVATGTEVKPAPFYRPRMRFE
ncbi:DUF3306 domain-containing protein [Marinobacter caseinilyticus]|uniref:DUF3306 domain-containing protein n=1 Tax=Marinobacter caseinilyticus TaxID=2692195 RepID=UPI00140C334D|nr:DUF3306 domain-containing protein [Marinobacter caseinilyticus]